MHVGLARIVGMGIVALVGGATNSGPSKRRHGQHAGYHRSCFRSSDQRADRGRACTGTRSPAISNNFLWRRFVRNDSRRWFVATVNNQARSLDVSEGGRSANLRKASCTASAAASGSPAIRSRYRNNARWWSTKRRWMSNDSTTPPSLNAYRHDRVHTTSSGSAHSSCNYPMIHHSKL